jgi:hypothetical protein
VVPGRAIAVVAGGADLDGFEGTMHTGAALTGVTPPIGSGPIVIDRSQDLHVSWTPEGLADEEVLLTVRQIATDSVIACFCSAPDSAGELTVDKAVLATFGVEQLSCTMELERALTSTVLTDDAVVDLVSEVVQETSATFE